jgi:hypothetical protein
LEKLQRKQADLGDALEALDARLADAGGNTTRAWASLNETELEFIATEVEKCLLEPRYYLENYHFIKTKQRGLVPLWPFFDSQEMFLEVFERQFRLNELIRIIVLKARQVGLTTLSVALMCWFAFFHTMADVLSMSDEEDRTEVNFSMARTAHACLPWWMRPEKRYDVRGRLIAFDRAREDDRRRSSGMQGQIYFESANQPSGAAYSKCLSAVHLAEVARYRNSNAITEGIFGSLVELPGSIGIMESTARGRGGTWHRLCKKAQSSSFRWEFVFIEWFREPGYITTVPENFQQTIDERALVRKVKEQCAHELTDGQLQWRREKRDEFEATDGDAEKFSQEFPVTPAEAFIASGRTAFSKKRMQEMLTHFCKPPIWTGEIRLDEKDDKTFRMTKMTDGRLELWEYPKIGFIYKVAADPSMGIEGGDPAAVEVICVPEDINQPIRQVARWNGYAGPTHFARIVAAIGYLFNTAEVVPECNTITTVASDLVKVLLYPNWYRWMREDKARSGYSDWIGWQTTFRNRNELIGRMRDALQEWTLIIRSEKTLDEMFDFVEVEEGTERYEARAGQHDDDIMALMIANYVANQLRPRMDFSTAEEKPPTDQDWQNTDYSPIHDKDDIAQDRTGLADFYML